MSARRAPQETPRVTSRLACVLSAGQLRAARATGVSQLEREHTLREVLRDGLSLQYAPDALKNDYDVVKAAVQTDGRALQYASDTLRNDKLIVLAAVMNDSSAITFASDELRNDPSLRIFEDTRKSEHLNF